MGKKNSQFTVIALLDGELVCTVQLKGNRSKNETQLESSVNPNYNLLVLAETFAHISQHIEASYYSHEVKILSKDIREQIEAAMARGDISPAPF